MILDVVDAHNHNLMWRGFMADPVGNPANIGSKFARSAKEILDKFPVGEKTNLFAREFLPAPVQ